MTSFVTIRVLGCILMAVSASQGASKNIIETSKDLGLTTFLKEIAKARLTDILTSPQKHTIVAPTNKALEWIYSSENPGVDVNELTQILEFYIFTGPIYLEALSNEVQLLTASAEYPYARVNKYHQGKPTVQVATVQCAIVDLNKANQEASNGLVHVLNSLMFPPSGNILEYLEQFNDKFSTLISLVKHVGMDVYLKTPGPYTLFAPTNDAFDKLPAGTLDDLREDIPRLESILYLHLMSGTLCSAGIISRDETSAVGLGITLKKDSSGGVTVQNAKVTAPDRSVTNGVVHHIDQVILNGNPLH